MNHAGKAWRLTGAVVAAYALYRGFQELISVAHPFAEIAAAYIVNRARRNVFGKLSQHLNFSAWVLGFSLLQALVSFLIAGAVIWFFYLRRQPSHNPVRQRG